MKKITSIIVLTCLLLAVPCVGATITVDSNGTGDFNNIKAAINDSNDGDIIVVNPGTYTGLNNRNLDFLGKAITLMSTDPNEPDIVAATIIDCEALGRGFLFLSGEDANSIVDGFIITNGKGDLGGGIYCEQSSPTVRNCIFSGNNSKYVGGGIYCDQSSPTVRNCIFSENSSTLYDGGGMANFFAASPNVSNCTFINNSARDGGGMCNRKVSTSPKVTNCTFINNSATRFGGGIFNSESASTNVTNCTIVSNSASSVGGGIYNYFNSTPTIVNCIIWDNNPSEIDGYNSNFTVSYCDVKGGYSGPGSGEGNININPLFVDPNAGDYHLLPASPCIDAGDPCHAYAGQTDIDGELRVFSGRVDIGSDEACPDVEVTPVGHDFGDVEVGTSATTIATISNLGRANLTVSSMGFTTGSNSDFSITSGPNLPAAIEPNVFVDVEISYSPSVEGYATAILEITTDDPDESVEEVALGGAGVIIEVPPSQQVVDILLFIEASVNVQTLVGSGPGNSAEGRLGALINMIEATGDLIEAELFEEGCQQLRDAYRRIDGEPRPPDFASGEASAELAGMIENLRLSLGCE